MEEYKSIRKFYYTYIFNKDNSDKLDDFFESWYFRVVDLIDKILDDKTLNNRIPLLKKIIYKFLFPRHFYERVFVDSCYEWFTTIAKKMVEQDIYNGGLLIPRKFREERGMNVTWVRIMFPILLAKKSKILLPISKHYWEDSFSKELINSYIQATPIFVGEN